MKDSVFEKLVKEALLEIPEHIREKMDNVAIVIEKGSPRGSLLGLYQGVPQNMWARGFGMRLPDKITIFQAPLERMARSREEAERISSLFHLHPASQESVLKEIVKNVVWHEVAHHFGFSEKSVRELEAKRRKK